MEQRINKTEYVLARTQTDGKREYYVLGFDFLIKETDVDQAVRFASEEQVKQYMKKAGYVYVDKDPLVSPNQPGGWKILRLQTSMVIEELDAEGAGYFKELRHTRS